MLDVHLEMVLEVLPDAGHVGHHVDAVPFQQAGRAHPRQLEQLGGVDRAPAQDHLARPDPPGPAPVHVLDAGGPGAVEHHPLLEHDDAVEVVGHRAEFVGHEEHRTVVRLEVDDLRQRGLVGQGLTDEVRQADPDRDRIGVDRAPLPVLGRKIEIVEKLHHAFVEAAKTPEMKEIFERGGMVAPSQSSVEDASKWLKEQMDTWRRDIAEAGIVIEE